MRRRPLLALLALALAALSADPASAGDDERKRRPSKMMRSFDFDDAFAPSAAAEMGATPGGAQDIEFFRSRVNAGEIPHPNVFTPEGLFSQHDLPIAQGGRCGQLLCAVGEAIPASLLVQPEVRYLAQLGFSSGLDAATFKRQPLHLVAVVDKSGSMSGQPLELVKESLLEAVDRLGPDDMLSIVLYGDRAHVHLSPTRIADKRAVARGIRKIESAGSTAMEEGLKVGFDLARAHAGRFQGTSRVMLFTDERPNVGRTDAQSFMAMARDASKAGIGMTTVGVGVQFGAELATEISSVRGGNLFFFPDLARMKKVFEEDFDTMVTELAYDLQLEIRPAKGLKIAGVYGIPGKALKWGDDGSIRVSVETIFVSRKKGAIYVALASQSAPGTPETRIDLGKAVASIGLKYLERGGARRSSQVSLALVPGERASVGLSRGRVLVDEATSLAKAAALHHEQNDQEGAYQIVHALAGILRGTIDRDLADERVMVENLEGTLAKLSGHAGEPGRGAPAIDRVSGLPRQDLR
ncbi:MAG: VWA domain-containing protein [Myxococcales bacterium]|nr:VWA domain-containing protein [Myxococcales bacterium]